MPIHRQFLLAVPAIAALVGAAARPATPLAPAASSPAQGNPVVATLVPTLGARARGLVTLSPGRRANEVRAKITVTEVPGNAQLGWVIRQGACGENGPELGPLAAYRPIQTRSDGTAELAVYLPIAMPSADAYHVDLLRERGGADVLACGGLTQDDGK